MKQRTMVKVWLIVGLLWVAVGLRDVFAPGFFTMSGRVQTTSDIVIEFGVAALFFAMAALSIISRQPKSLSHK
jgi:hypothetical protein